MDNLKARHQKVVVRGGESVTIPVISGVPQGSVLGSLLFLIYIVDVTRVPLSVDTKLHSSLCRRYATVQKDRLP